ncbi:MAG: DUF1365 domain-containing protein [Chromatiaceae bacterium]|nr:DUF1365 domain-containing protein [Chromatiaceae bacterium]MCP5423332.1 DUF1365 domain-containing protein [Chromatiaceae bacterium]
MNAAAVIYACKVMHRRFGDFDYRFRYRTFSVLLDIDRLQEVDRISRWFSVDRFNLLSFHRADHLPRGQSDLRGWLTKALAPFGVDVGAMRVRLLCMPRVLGLGFDPLSVWYCEGPQGNLLAAVCEVHNTFSERHCYVLLGDGSAPLRSGHAKQFHVSPFMPLDGAYRFVLQPPRQQLGVLIHYAQNNQPRLVASQRGRRLAFSSTNLLRQCVRVPVQTLKVVAGIHWHALLIWWRGARLHRKPEPPLNEVS